MSNAPLTVIVGSGLSELQKLMDDDYRVTCGMQVANCTAFSLVDPKVRLTSGVLSTPPEQILPSKTGYMVSRKKWGALCGTAGTVSWEIKGLDRRLFIMWDAPFNFHFYNNCLAVGLSKCGNVQHQTGEEIYNIMRYQGSSNVLAFERRSYENDIDSVKYSDDGIEITAIMGNTHKADVKVTINQVNDANVTQPFKDFHGKSVD